jgi:glycosyltransferase involved in cell wall biosynthesis
VYAESNVLIVHSDAAMAALRDRFPSVVDRAVVAPIGLYTTYPRRPSARAQLRQQWRVDPETPVVLVFGGLRPYKNIDLLLGALAREPRSSTVVVVAGVESGYPDAIPEDPLARTRGIVERLGLQDRVRLFPGFVDENTTARFFEASDIVVLPYTESYGSGILLLAMTFGKYVVATAAGAMDQYLTRYPLHSVLRNESPEAVARALHEAEAALRLRAFQAAPADIPELAWTSIVARLLPELRARLSFDA